MAENKKSFIAYIDWQDTFNVLPDDKAGQLIKHLFAYVNDENPETDDLLIKAAFANIKRTLKRDLCKYDIIREKRSLAGKASADRKQQVLTSVDKCSDVFPDNVNDNVNDNDNDKVNKREAKFKSEVFLFLESYPEIMLNKFCDYWTEKNKSKTKMRFELEKTFEISKRISTWANRDRTIIKDTKPVVPQFSSGPGR